VFVIFTAVDALRQAQQQHLRHLVQSRIIMVHGCSQKPRHAYGVLLHQRGQGRPCLDFAQKHKLVVAARNRAHPATVVADICVLQQPGQKVSGIMLRSQDEGWS